MLSMGWLLRSVAMGRSLVSIGMLITRLILLSILMSSMLLLWLMTWPTCLLRYGGALLKWLVVFLQLHSLSHFHSRSGTRTRTFRRPVMKSETPAAGMIIKSAVEIMIVIVV